MVADQNEDLVGGWTLLSPREPGTLRTFPFEEVVLLVTDKAIYAVRFDWNMEKVAGFERVDLRSIIRVRKGVYVTSTLATAQTDEDRNVGFIVTYRPGESDVAKINTRSLSTVVSPRELGGDSPEQEGQSHALPDQSAEHKETEADCDLDGPGSHPPKPARKDTELKILAFKALPSKSVSPPTTCDNGEGPELSEKETVRIVCEEIGRVVRAAGGGIGEGERRGVGGGDVVEEGAIISFAEARKSTGLLEQLGHSLKKLVWA